MKALRFGLIPVTAIALASCTAYQQQGALIGGIAGGLAGAAFGDDHQDVIAGAAVGAGLGTGAAAIHEDSVRRRNYQQYGIPPEQQGRPQPPRQQTRPPTQQTRPAPQQSDYPTAQRTTNPDEVLSPYPPHNRINVQGYRSGQLVKDPNTGEIFRVP
ncbi:hypothetical protein HAHE_14820 [Haloferula helveola]|uniref:Glycine zipper domain-containing protein n=1 Tax=Haloferula helveola TaxID=490095 RepID=A0ABM7R8X9_9BACT|nr:hypothetical protein HAHE_14820 [Haloferula helveola]